MVLAREAVERELNLELLKVTVFVDSSRAGGKVE
jgi:hypothetical protein